MSIFIRTFACMKKMILHTNLVTTTKALLHVVSLLSVPLLLTAAILMAACSGDDASNTPTPTNDKTEIAFNTATTTWHDATRATTYDNNAALQGETEGFACYAYNAGEATNPYINGSNVKYVDSEWKFQDGKHYWPAEGSLDFFAHVPAILPSCITNNSDVASKVTYVARNPQFKCKNLPMAYSSASPTENQGSGLQEIMLAMATGQNKAGQGASGVALRFYHPFTRIKMVLSASQAKDITINTITFKSLKNNGFCSFAYNESTSKWVSTWTPSGDATDFKATLNQAFIATGSAQEIGVPYIMIPQTWSGAIEVEATWDDWGVSLKHTLSTTLPPITWAAGTSYTYTFTISETELIVDGTKYTEQW